ncbi:hypothetical protein KAJ87_02715 [Candidatus Pacearchaeota archaeon]|nr:hypothetical protein [Candidatus Pacearchaeota archaeon]
MESPSIREQRIRKITQLYYSRQDVQKAILEFSKNREVVPRYFEGFGKRPDSLQYQGDVLELVKKGATSFHCSEELWQDPLNLVTGMDGKKLNELRIGWDLLIDIDCPWIDYSKKAAEAIVKVFRDYGISNVGVKYSGSKGFHILLPWKAFPKELAGEKTSNLFPEMPKKLVSYIGFRARPILESLLNEEDKERIKKSGKIKQGVKCNNCSEIAQEYISINYLCPKCRRQELRKVSPGEEKDYQCPDCNVPLEVTSSKKIYVCNKCNIHSEQNPSNFSVGRIESDIFEVLGLDLVLVSPRHLFRMPYSLHEKTALSSVVIDPEEIKDFDMKDADPLKVAVKNFMPQVLEGEAEKLIREAFDWTKENEIKSGNTEKKISGKYENFKPIVLKNIEDSQFPPCVQKILKGVPDGKKRALFVLINLFRSVGMDKEELEKKIFEWNKKNEVPLREGYIRSQLSWSYRRKPLLPPNCKNFYQGIGICVPDAVCNTIKNPVNYVVRKNLGNKKNKNNNKF